MISSQDRERYGRQIMLEEVGEQGQLRLAKSRVLVVGAGDLDLQYCTILPQLG